jgi:hypothetical protein
MLDGVMLLWFVLAAIALLFVAIDIRTTPESPVLKWGFVLVTAYTGVVGAFLYVLGCREPLPGLHWEPRSRLVLSWDITADWQYDPALQTEIEVRFITEGDAGTRVEFEHRRLDRYGDRRDEMRTIFDKTGDWGRLLAAFAQTAVTSARAD